MKKLRIPLIIIMVLTAVYLAGPQVAKPDLSKPPQKVPQDLHQLEAFINQSEGDNPKIKAENEARIVWADSAYQKTEYCLVYLHGWSASQKEGDPLHRETAKRYGMNLYLSRLAGHGVKEEEPMLNLTGADLMQSAREAIEIGKVLGDKVIVMSTSTGGTLGLYLAAEDSDIAALILYSPNIDLKDKSSVLLTKHWGLQFARLVVGSKYYQWDLDSTRAQYWTNKYRLEALTQLRELMDVTMTKETFKKVTQPVFLGYYYKNDTAQDDVVSVEAMLKMYDELGTPANQKEKRAFPNAGHHVIGCELTSEDIPAVREATFGFIQDKLGLKPQLADSLLMEPVEM